MEDANNEALRRRVADIETFLDGQSAEVMEYDESLARRLIEKITVYDDHYFGRNLDMEHSYHGSVAQPRGCVHVGEGNYETTIYSSCCNTDKGIYYYITYENSQITGVDMHRTDLEGSTLTSYPLITRQRIHMMPGFKVDEQEY